jgi:hypothetical protein
MYCVLGLCVPEIEKFNSGVENLTARSDACEGACRGAN